MTDEFAAGADLAHALVQGLVDRIRDSNDRAIDYLGYDSHRYHVLTNAVLDFADQIDSRATADRLRALVNRIQNLDPDQACTLARTVNYFDREASRVDFDAEWSH